MSVEDDDEFLRIRFKDGPAQPFFYPKSCSWIDLCQTIDEIKNPRNWHYFFNAQVQIKSGDVVMDCGAAEGLFAYFAAPLAATVYVVEPMPVWHPALEKTFAQFPNARIIRAALGHRSAAVRMTDDEIYSAVSKNGTVEVDVTTIDAIITKDQCRVDFIKADVEGYEMRLLLGAEETIMACHPNIAITTYHRENHWAEMEAYLKSLYDKYIITTRGISEHGAPVMLHAG